MSDGSRGDKPKNFAGDRYEVIRVLGTGGTATVYLVRDTLLDVLRALKVLRVGNTDLGRRLAAEARMMANLDNPHILRVVDVGEDAGRPYIVMEYLPGGTLADIGEEGPLPVSAALSWMLQVLAALSAAHEVGIVHRDVKPSNVLLDAKGVASLADFGIAMRDGTDEERSTRTGVAMGTLAFMAPEQRLDARSVSRSADLYAVGSSLYSLLTYRSAMDLFVVQAGDKRMRGVPPELEAILLKATRYQADERYDTAAEMADELWSILPSASREPLFAVDDNALPPAAVRTATPGPLASRIWPPADVTARAMQTMSPSARASMARTLAAQPTLIPSPPSENATLLPAVDSDEPVTAAAGVSRAWLYGAFGLGALVFVFVALGWVCLAGDGAVNVDEPGGAELALAMDPDTMDAVADVDLGTEPDTEADTAAEPEPAVQPAPEPRAVVAPRPVVAPEPVPEPSAGEFPFGRYAGYLDSRPVDLRLTGTADALSANITTWFSEADRTNGTDNRQSRTMTGTWDASSDTLTLADQGDFNGSGTIEATWTGRAFTGRFRDRRGTHITSFEARPR